MKKLIRTLCFVGTSLFLIPIIIIYGSGYNRAGMLAEITSAQMNQDEESEETLLDESLIIPILAKEIPYTYEDEAIKAETLVIRTYMARRALGMQTKNELVGYTEDEMRALWQDEYESIYAAYKEAVESTQNEMILYNGQPIQPIYHKSSGTMTRDAKDVYGVEVPYLVSAQNQNATINSQMKMSKAEVIIALKKKYPNLIVDEKMLENQIQIIEKDEAGYIKNIQVGNVILDGESFRSLLGLESSNFKIYLSGDNLIFDVIGSGNGVGLSLDGANELAKQGSDYKEILNHYYKDTEIKKYGDLKENE